LRLFTVVSTVFQRMFTFRTLGSLELRSDSGEEVAGVLAAQKLVALLAYLAVATPHGLHRRDSVIGLLWPELTQERARAALRHSVYRLRGMLGPDALISRGDEDVGISTSIITCDAARLDELLDSGSIDEALDLYRGDLMPGFFLRGTPEYERWLDGERTRLRNRASSAACRLAEDLARSGKSEEAAHRARQVLAISPDSEQLLRRVMNTLASVGDSAGAVHVFDQFAARMKAELDASPSSETRSLAAKLREDRSDAGPVVATASPLVTDSPATPHVSEPAVATSVMPLVARRGSRRSVIALAVAATVMVGAYGVKKVTADASPATPTIAVFPFDVRGSRDLDYLKEGMSDLLSIGVDGAAGLHSADPRAVLARVRENGDTHLDEGDARRIARQVGAGLYITGTVVEAGGQITLTAALRDVNGRVQSTAQTRAADKGRLFELVDDLSRQLLAGADRSAPELVGLAARTTKSMPALRSYLEGERELRAGRHVSALDAFREAVAEDSTFALAYYRLSSAGRWTTEYQLAEEATDKAVRYDNSLPPYARRLLDAATAMRDGNYEESESLYVASTRSRPGDAEAWFGLGDLHYHYNALRGRSKLQSRKSFERALALDPGDGESRVHLLELAAWEGKVAEVDSLLEGLPKGSDFGEKWPIIRALITDDRNAEEKAVAELKKGDERATVLMVIHSTSAFPNNLPGAVRVTGLLTDPSRSPARRAYGFNLRAQVELARGKWSLAKRDLLLMGTLEPAAATEYGAILSLSPGATTTPRDLGALRSALTSWDAAPTPPSASPVFGIHNGFHSQLRLYLLGLVSDRMGDTTAAKNYADSLATFPGDTLKVLLAGNLAHAVRARVIARRGNVAAALAELGHPWIDPRTHRSHYSSILAQVADRYFMAELLQRTGRFGEALEAYSAVSDYSLDGLMYLPMSHLRRGDIYLQMGDRARAVEHYAKFVALSKDCEPELVPLRNAAEKKIAALRKRLS
jgi:DNA-binding SARP family transcriptional activator/tetratricopeptide (TPR) repeat protein